MARGKKCTEKSDSAIATRQKIVSSCGRQALGRMAEPCVPCHGAKSRRSVFSAFLHTVGKEREKAMCLNFHPREARLFRRKEEAEGRKRVLVLPHMLSVIPIPCFPESRPPLSPETVLSDPTRFVFPAMPPYGKSLPFFLNQ